MSLEAGTPDELRRLLEREGFDVLALRTRTEADARELSDVLDELPLPMHTILLGNASALPLTPRRKRLGATFRFAPGSLDARGLAQLIDHSIRSGSWDESIYENGETVVDTRVDLQDTIDSAAAVVYKSARRKGLRFNTTIAGETADAYGRPRNLHDAFVSLFGLTVDLAPRGALVSVDAQTGADEWLVRIAVKNGKDSTRSPGEIVETLRHETDTLTSVSETLREQGGMLWVELHGTAGAAFSVALRMPPDVTRGASASA